jgi:deoxyribodipyrimidine photo-lyase
MTELVWFRNDLRLADNPALTAACAGNAPVRACFILTPGQWQAHDWSPARVRFVVDHANDLARQLARLGIPMHFLWADRFDDALDRLIEHARQHRVRRIHFNEEYGINERRRDKALKQRAERDGVVANKYRDQSVAPVGKILTAQGTPYTVFTPFSRRWRQWLDHQPPQVLPTPRPRAEALEPKPIAAVPDGFDPAPPALVATGEAAAHARLARFLDAAAGHYKTRRDVPALDGTSGLSPYLASGVLSGRQCLVAAQAARTAGNREGVDSWINEIAWRDFYIHILYHYPQVSMHRAFKPETEALDWNGTGPAFEAWKAGQTGVPIVDAAMRQLAATGWMHNRLRMITAMFLSKNLFIDWRLGEAWFMSRLVDGFLASNNGGWQWSASTGTDAAPYFRIFNPVSQSARFDPDGEFIRRWVPELAALDSKRIHQPWQDGPTVKGYPGPIVDLKASRQAAIARFRALKDGAEGG